MRFYDNMKISNKIMLVSGLSIGLILIFLEWNLNSQRLRNLQMFKSSKLVSSHGFSNQLLVRMFGKISIEAKKIIE